MNNFNLMASKGRQSGRALSRAQQFSSAFLFANSIANVVVDDGVMTKRRYEAPVEICGQRHRREPFRFNARFRCGQIFCEETQWPIQSVGLGFDCGPREGVAPERPPGG
jgi:hypothetical protein